MWYKVKWSRSRQTVRYNNLWPDQIDIATTVTGSQATDYDIEKSTGLGAAEIILRVVCLVSYGALST